LFTHNKDKLIIRLINGKITFIVHIRRVILRRHPSRFHGYPNRQHAYDAQSLRVTTLEPKLFHFTGRLPIECNKIPLVDQDGNQLVELL